MKTKEERLVALEELLKSIALQILEALEPNAAEAVYGYRNRKEHREEQDARAHGPYCRYSEYKHEGTDATGEWVYCSQPYGHGGPCSFTRAMASAVNRQLKGIK